MTAATATRQQQQQDVPFAGLPPGLRAVLQRERDACRSRFPRAEGVVGPKPATLGVRQGPRGVLRVDCWDNPPFWLEVCPATLAVCGRPAFTPQRQPGGDGGNGGSLVASSADGGRAIRITHTSCPDFIVTIALAPLAP